ncbi:MAG: hypothetical protein EOS84_14660 [Mesorhizobium sp.]|nr:MAG: hypothetical protein EOS84_14660 [Mesorhizobium sp.]
MPDISPTRGGDWLSSPLSPISNAEERALSVKLPISPQVGEMSGRTEGGAKDHYGFILRRSLPPTSRNGDR